MVFRKYVKDLILTFVLGIVFLFLGLVVTFLFLNATLSPQEIALLILPPGWNQAQYDAVFIQYGLNDPIFSKFIRYIFDFFSGSLDYSYVFAIGMPVNELLGISFPRTIELLILPLSIGIILGFVFGRVSNRTKHKWLKSGIQLCSAVGIAVPIFFFSMYLQYTLGYENPLLPTTGYKTFSLPNPPFITGFLILDSLISGNGLLAADIIMHYILPTLVLTVAITALMTRVFSSKLVEDSFKKNTIISNTTKTSAVFGVILIYLILIDVTFNLVGFGDRFIFSLYLSDFFLLRGFMFVFIIFYVITIFISNLIFCLNRWAKDKKQHPLKDLEETTEREPKISPKIESKNKLNKIAKYTITIVGLVAVIIPIIISIFPQLVTIYSFEDANGIFLGAWNPSSPNHPLGTSYFGRDVLALIVYGTRDSLILGLGAVLIGLIGGLIFGLLANKFNRVGHTLIMGLLLIFYVLPGILLVMLFTSISGSTFVFLMFTTGFLLIPCFTRIIANAEFRITSIGKKIISYIPLFAGFAILFYMSLGFLGFYDPLTINLGGLIREGRIHLYDAPWASYWPGLISFLILTALFVLHEILVEYFR